MSNYPTLPNGSRKDSYNKSISIQEKSGKNIPILADTNFLEQAWSINRKNVVERVVHARGIGVRGHFICTSNNINNYTSARFLRRRGVQTDVFCRFSTTVGSKGSHDVVRDTLGMAVRFYTQQGNCDFVTLSFPIFAINDAIKFTSLVNSNGPDPSSGIEDENNKWEFALENPETSPFKMFLFSDRGIAKSFRHIDGYVIHALKLINYKGEVFYAKFEFDTDEGT
jgi:catalase